MATSAFKSTSRRPSTSSSTTTTTATNKQTSQQSRKQLNSTQKVPHRRSRSVSAFSRTQLDTTAEFQNKRENPLFWVDGSSHFEEDADGFKLSKFEISKYAELKNLEKFSNGGGESRRGRSISRSSGGERKFSSGGGGGRTNIGRSLSRVHATSRRRSPSRGHYRNSESEKEENDLLNFGSKNKIGSNANHSLLEGKSKLVRSASDLSEVLKGSYTWSSQHPAFETSDDSTANLSGSLISHWDDGISTSSILEAEERTIKPISAEKAMLRSDSNGIHGCSVSDLASELENNNTVGLVKDIRVEFASELENTNTVGLVRDIREEFARELEECEERTRKLRAELAVEEHREFELNKILNDVPVPKTPLVEIPYGVRKASFERKKMSKRLEQEALAYFDECVSISTFEDSDFSSLEDLPSNMASVDGLGGGLSFSGVPRRSSGGWFFETQENLRTTSDVHCNLTHNQSTCNNTSEANNLTHGSSDTTSLKEDIRNYVKKISKNSGTEGNNTDIVSASYENARDYYSESSMEKLLLDRVTFKSRIEFGSMLLCGLPVPPFSPFLW